MKKNEYSGLSYKYMMIVNDDHHEWRLNYKMFSRSKIDDSNSIIVDSRVMLQIVATFTIVIFL